MAKKKKTVKAELDAGKVTGRKRDPALDGQILNAAIQTLAEVGFDQMTMDEVAARCGSAKTTVYRRWPSKAELVRDALIWMSKSSVDVEKTPDTGTLRGDLLAVQKDYSPEHSEKKVRVLSKLGSFHAEHPKAAAVVMAQVFGPMNELNGRLMKRALERGEISASASIELACQTISATITYRTSYLHESFDKSQYAKLLDGVIIPALKFGMKK